MDLRWWRRPVTQRSLDLGTETPDQDDYLRMLPAYLFVPKGPQPLERNLTQGDDGVPTDLQILVEPPRDVLDVQVAPWQARMTVRTRRGFGPEIGDGVVGVLLGIPAVAFAVLVPQPAVRVGIFAGWLGIVAFLRSRRRSTPPDPAPYQHGGVHRRVHRHGED